MVTLDTDIAFGEMISQGAYERSQSVTLGHSSSTHLTGRVGRKPVITGGTPRYFEALLYYDTLSCAPAA